MPRFISWGIQKLKGVFATVAAFFAKLFGFFRKKSSSRTNTVRTYTYTVSNDDIEQYIADNGHPANYVAEILKALNTVNPECNLFTKDLNRFSSVVCDSKLSSGQQPDDNYDLNTLGGRIAIVTDTLSKYGLTFDQMKPALAFLTQRLPHAVIMVIFKLFFNEKCMFLPTNGTSTLAINNSRISLTYDLTTYVIRDIAATDEDIKKHESGQDQLHILTVASIDLAKLKMVDGKIQPGSNAITQTSTITVIKDLDLDFENIGKKLHKDIQDGYHKKFENHLIKKNLFTVGFSNTPDPTPDNKAPQALSQSPKLKSD